jgi:hypothetical protein
MTIGSLCTHGPGRTIALGLACFAFVACSGTASSPGPDAGSVEQSGSSSGGSMTMTHVGSSSSSGGNVGAGNCSSSSSGVASSSSSGGNGIGVITGGSSGSSGGMRMSMDDAGGSGEGGGADSGSGAAVASSSDGGAGCPAAAVFCDGFESGTMLGSAWTVDNSVAANTVTVVSTKSHSGANSVHLTFTGAVGTTFIDEKLGVTATGTVWGRVWMYPNTEADNGIGPDPHVVYIEAEPAGFTGHSATGVRPLNTQSGKVAINVAPPDNGPSANIALPEGAWHCFEWEISGIGRNGSVALYMDGTSLATDMGTAIAAIGEMRIGCERYNAGTTTGDMYLDDYAIGPSRMGCN